MGMRMQVKDLNPHDVVVTTDGQVGYLTKTETGEKLLIHGNVAYRLQGDHFVDVIVSARDLAREFIEDYLVKPTKGYVGAVMISSVVSLPDGQIGVVEHNNYAAANATIAIPLLGTPSVKEITVPFGRAIEVLKRPGTLAYNWIWHYYPPLWAEK